MNISIPIYFYIPQKHLDYIDLPKSPDIYWSGFREAITGGVYASTIQTYLRLKDSGVDCSLIGHFPDRGIVLAHRDFLPDYLMPKREILLVCLKWDRTPHPYAQLHAVFNPHDLDQMHVFLNKKTFLPYGKRYIPHWLQPGLIPRDPQRGDLFENIAFIGNKRQLAPELLTSEWQENLKALGLRWHVVDSDRQHAWNDFSYIDAILAVRGFQSSSDYSWKPALKLYNSWSAGVPAILGKESGYQSECQSELDYIEVSSIEQAIEALKQLKNDPELRHCMVQNGLDRAREWSNERIVKIWQDFLLNEAVPAYQVWKEAPASKRYLFLLHRHLATAPSRIYQKGLHKEVFHIYGLYNFEAATLLKEKLKKFKSDF